MNDTLSFADVIELTAGFRARQHRLWGRWQAVDVDAEVVAGMWAAYQAGVRDLRRLMNAGQETLRQSLRVEARYQGVTSPVLTRERHANLLGWSPDGVDRRCSTGRRPWPCVDRAAGTDDGFARVDARVDAGRFLAAVSVPAAAGEWAAAVVEGRQPSEAAAKRGRRWAQSITTSEGASHAA